MKANKSHILNKKTTKRKRNLRKDTTVNHTSERTMKKVGVEHASREVLEEALKNIITYKTRNDSLSYNDFVELGLIGKKESTIKREEIYKKFHLGKCNAKTLYKRLNMLGIKKEQI